jgi:hypothetical protein
MAGPPCITKEIVTYILSLGGPNFKVIPNLVINLVQQELTLSRERGLLSSRTKSKVNERGWSRGNASFRSSGISLMLCLEYLTEKLKTICYIS